MGLIRLSLRSLTPVTELPQYKRFSELLVDINEKNSDHQGFAGQLRPIIFALMNICDRGASIPCRQLTRI